MSDELAELKAMVAALTATVQDLKGKVAAVGPQGTPSIGHPDARIGPGKRHPLGNPEQPTMTYVELENMVLQHDQAIAALQGAKPRTPATPPKTGAGQ